MEVRGFKESELRWKSVELMELKGTVCQKKLSHADAQGVGGLLLLILLLLLLLLLLLWGSQEGAEPPLARRGAHSKPRRGRVLSRAAGAF